MKLQILRSIALLGLLLVVEVSANYDYICFHENSQNDWSACEEGGFSDWNTSNHCRIYTGVKKQVKSWFWGNTREGCSGRRTFRGAELRTARGGAKVDIAIKNAKDDSCWMGAGTEAFQQHGYQYDLVCTLSAFGVKNYSIGPCVKALLESDETIDAGVRQYKQGLMNGQNQTFPDGSAVTLIGILALPEFSDANKDFLVACLVDQYEQETLDAYLVSQGGDYVSEQACQYEQCDQFDPICSSNFGDSNLWHQVSDFPGLSCEVNNCSDDMDGQGEPAGCNIETGVSTADQLLAINNDTCRMRVCDYSGRCSVCEPSPKLKFDDGTCLDSAGNNKFADGICSQATCNVGDSECLCITGQDSTACATSTTVNCFNNPLHAWCKSSSFICQINPTYSGCKAQNPCLPTTGSNTNCPADHIAFCQRNKFKPKTCACTNVPTCTENEKMYCVNDGTTCGACSCQAL